MCMKHGRNFGGCPALLIQKVRNMKPQTDKDRFILLRAEGKSFTAIAQELHISKSTCSEWEQELKGKIADLKADRLNELYEKYYMTRRARIEQAGKTLAKIDEAIAGADLTEADPVRLMELKLKYLSALKEEYIDTGRSYNMGKDIEPQQVIDAMGKLLNDVAEGSVTPEQAAKENYMLNGILKAMETHELKQKLDALETILASR